MTEAAEDVISAVPASRLGGWLVSCGRLGASADHAKADLELAGALAATLAPSHTIRAIDEERLEQTIRRLERRHVSAGWMVKRERGVGLVRALDRHYAASRQAGADRLERERAEEARLAARRAAQPPMPTAEALWLERAQLLSAPPEGEEVAPQPRRASAGATRAEADAA